MLLLVSTVSLLLSQSLLGSDQVFENGNDNSPEIVADGEKFSSTNSSSESNLIVTTRIEADDTNLTKPELQAEIHAAFANLFLRGENSNENSTITESQVISESSRSANGDLLPTSSDLSEVNEDALHQVLETKQTTVSTEERLYRTLLSTDTYEKDVRPAIDHSKPTNVTFGFLLNQIVEMDERNQVLTTRSWLNINWIDQRLRWNDSQWEGIKTIYIPYQRLWKPDIILVNNAIREYHASLVSTDIIATSDGNITWLLSALFRSSCPIRVRYYPFDDQVCDLKFASWSHDLSEIDLGLNTDKGDLSSYMNNSEFDLLDMVAIKEVANFSATSWFEWPMIVIRIKMHRRPMFYVFNHIIPCVLISSMAVLGFLMPPETGEKVNMIITTLLSMGVYLQSITESIPPTSEAVPLIGIYYVSSLSIVCLATCVNVITLNIHRNGAVSQGRHVPHWMEKWVLGYLASIMQVTIKQPDNKTLLGKVQGRKSDLRNNSIFYESKTCSSNDCHKRGMEDVVGDGCECMGGAEKTDANPNFASNDSTANNNVGYNQLNGKSTQNLSEDLFMGYLLSEQILSRISVCRPALSFEGHFRRVLKRLYRSLEQHEIREEIIDERQRIRWQWQHLASVVDRLLLVLFSSATLFTITFFLVLPVGLRSKQP